MGSNRIKQPVFFRFLTATVLVGSIAFASQVEAQQPGRSGKARPERGAEGRGARGERRDPAQMVERRVARLTEHLKLSSGQATAIRQIMLDEHAKIKALRPDSIAREQRRNRPDSAAREQGRAQMKALRERTDARIEGVLSGEQRVAYRELVKNRGDRMKGGPGHRGPGRDGRGRVGGRQASAK